MPVLTEMSPTVQIITAIFSGLTGLILLLGLPRIIHEFKEERIANSRMRREFKKQRMLNSKTRSEMLVAAFQTGQKIDRVESIVDGSRGDMLEEIAELKEMQALEHPENERMQAIAENARKRSNEHKENLEKARAAQAQTTAAGAPDGAGVLPVPVVIAEPGAKVIIEPLADTAE